MEVAKAKGPGRGVRALFGGRKKRKAGEKGKAEYTGDTPGFEDREAAEMRLAMTAANIQNNFVDPVQVSGQPVRFLDEKDPRSGEFIEDVLFTDTYGAGGEKATATGTPWSASTTSAHVRGFLGANSNKEAKEMGFRPYGAHRMYMNDAFKTKALKKDETYEYDAYEAKRLIGKQVNELRAGDLLFKGYNDVHGDTRDFKNTKDWKFNKFKKSGEKGEKYNSHTDIIVATGVDHQGQTYYDIAGGNVENEYMLKRIYPDEIRDSYKGAMISKR
jgi:hypothetical protein